MPVLKTQNSTPLIRDAVVLDLGDLGRQAALLKAAAQQRAQRILEDARVEAQRITAGAQEAGHAAGHAAGLAQGLEEGRAQGHAQALADAQQHVQQVTQTMAAVAADWQQHRAALETEARAAVLRFALRFAEKLTHRVIQVRPEVVVDQVAAALRHVLEPTDVVIHTHPDDRPILEEVLPQLMVNLTQIQHVTCHEDPEVGRGGCVLGLRGGEVDATLDTQIRRLVELIQPDANPPADAAAPDVHDPDGTPSPVAEGSRVAPDIASPTDPDPSAPQAETHPPAPPPHADESDSPPPSDP